MPLATTTVNGTITLPDGGGISIAILTFALVRLQTVTPYVLPTANKTVQIAANGDFTVELAPNDPAQAPTYLVTLTVYNSSGAQVHSEQLGYIAVPAIGPVELAELIVLDPPESTQSDALAQALAAAAAATGQAVLAQGYAIDAEDSAADAALYSTPYLDDVAAVLADTSLAYGAGAGQVQAGDYIRTRAEGFSYEVADAGAVDHDISTAGGVKLYRVTQQTVEVTVGSGGDFTTVNAALTFLDGQRRTYGSGATATVRLLTGFEMAEQVLLDGQDLGWITIVSDDAVVSVDETAITENLAPIDDARPVFGAANGAVLPVIGALFAYDDNSTAWDGVAVYGGSISQIEPECGVQRCRRGIQVYNAARAYCNMDGLRSGAGSATSQLGVDFRECSGRALDVQQGSFAHLPRANFDDCEGDAAVYLIWGSRGNIYQSSVRRATGTAILARDGSVLCARECDMDQAGNRAVHALHASMIDARHSPSSGFGTFGAINCAGTIAVLASAASTIDADSLPVSGAAGRGFSAGDGSTINAQLADAENCGDIAIMAERGSTINCNLSKTSGSPIGYQATESSTINAADGEANSCGFGVLATSGSQINARGISATGCNRAIEVRHGSRVAANSAVLTNSVDRALSVIDGGEANCDGANSAGAVGFHLTVRGGGRVSARGFNGDIDLRTGGGIVHNENGTGAVSQTVNTLTAKGIIFR